MANRKAKWARLSRKIQREAEAEERRDAYWAQYRKEHPLPEEPISLSELFPHLKKEGEV